MNVKRNKFGLKVYSPFEILGDSKLKIILKVVLYDVFEQLGINTPGKKILIKDVLNFTDADTQEEFEYRVRELLNGYINKKKLLKALERRAHLIADQVRREIVGKHIVDIGCGDGLVTHFLKNKNYIIQLVDVNNYLDKRVKSEFKEIKEGSGLNSLGRFDASLLLTVLHHSIDPLRLLKQVTQITRKRLIIIESVYGKFSNPHASVVKFQNLNYVTQRKYATFVDWFYNRILHDNIQVPYNFTTPSNWSRIFKSLGWTITKKIDLGFDQKIVPERHFLFVLDK